MLLYSYEEDIEQVSSGSTNHNSFMVIFAGINFLNLKKIGFNPCPSLPSPAKGDRKEFQCLNIIVSHKRTGPLCLEFNRREEKSRLAFFLPASQTL